MQNGDEAFSNAALKPDLHRDHAGQAAGGASRAEAGAGARGADLGQRPALVEAARLADESLIRTRRSPLSEADFPVHTSAPYARALRQNAREFPPK